MARVLALCVLVSSVVAAQPRVPSFLEPAALDPKLITPHLEAQASAPVRIDANGRGIVKVVVTPKAKMHVYAADVDGFVPFTFKVAGPTTVTAGKVTYPVSETYIFPPTGESSRVYMKPFEVTQAVVMSAEARKVLASGKRITGVGSLRYQACDDAVCYRPTTGSFVFEILQ
jgi:hypothetical protein